MMLRVSRAKMFHVKHFGTIDGRENHIFARRGVSLLIDAFGRGISYRRTFNATEPFYSARISPDPPNSAGKSLNFGSPSCMGSTVSA